MKTVGKCILSGIIGAALGSAATYFVTKKIVEEKERQDSIARCDEALKEQEYWFRKKYEEDHPKLTDKDPFEDEVNTENSEDSEEKEESHTDIPMIESVEIEKTDYHSIVKTHYDIPEEFEEANAYLEKKKPAKDVPYLISYDAYLGDDPEMEKDYYHKVDLVFYAMDYILNLDGTRTPCPILYDTEEERVMTEYEISKKLGYEWKMAFKDPTFSDEEFNAWENNYGRLKYDDNEVCVRNDSEATDYYIRKEYKYYKVDILEMDEDEPYDYQEAFE